MAEYKSSIGKNVSLKVGKMGEGEKMGVALEQTACFLENTFDITNEEGESLELRCEGGRVIDSTTKDGNILITGELYGLDDKDKFWQMDGNKVTSLVTDDFLSVDIAPDMAGATGIKAPKCKVSAGVAFNTAQGWRIPVTITVMKTKGDNGYYWEYYEVGGETGA